MQILLKEHLQRLGHSNKQIKSLLQTGKVFFQHTPVSDGRRMVETDDVSIRPRAPRITVGRDPVLVHRDNGFVVVYKPPGFLSVRAPYRHKDPNIIGFVYSLFGKAYPVHRLDEDTSGLMLVAIDEEMQSRLKDMIEQREIERLYLAICHGHFKATQTMETFFVRNRGDGKRGSGKEGKRAVSHFTPLAFLQGATLIQAKLETGRTHQIRIHLSEAKHPVLGDKLYGSRSVQNKSRRLALHAHQLSLRHPETKQDIVFKSPLADDLEKLRRELSAR